MPLTPAEKQRRYRERLKSNDPQKWKEMQEKNLVRTKNKYIPIHQLSESEKKVRRKEWRRYKQQKNEEKTEKTKISRKVYKKRHNKIKQENKKLREKVNTLMKKNKALKKTIYRYKILQAAHSQDNEDKENNISNVRDLTPNSKTESFANSLNISLSEKEKVKKELFHKNILCESIKCQYELASSNEKKNIIKKIVDNTLVKKYRTKSKLETIVGLKGRIRVPMKKVPVKHEALAQKIHNFFLRDDISRATADKKETKTMKKNKMQIRYLLESLTKLRHKFVQETNIPVSYTTFTRCKPFFVLSPNLSNRETCACKKHGNIEFKYAALKTLSILKFKDLDEFMKSIVCDTQKKECMYSECKKCYSKATTVYNLLECNLDDKVSWLEWTVKKIEYQKENQNKKAKRMVKIIQSGFSFATWNFFEASHGKGATDGIGGAIKRTLDKKVAYHIDITDLKTAFDTLKYETKVKLYIIKEEDINDMERRISSLDLVAVPETMLIHQIRGSFGMFELFGKQQPYVIGYRKLSCFCRSEGSSMSMIKGFCDCYSLKKYSLLKKKRQPFVTNKRKIIFSSDSENSDTVNDEIIVKSDYNAKYLKSRYFNSDFNKPSTSKVTILSNVKVNYKLSDLARMTKSAQSYNISSLHITHKKKI
ncbi:unnamed protein product [Euphydryas editha]|uniref:Uncharacterized protein n=1 Tax=Euphydryas editha TaxID=104508 RepID=A0AAU9U9Q2_EUPED|nr:unnamed protein product [Euphydryas editha]